MNRKKLKKIKKELVEARKSPQRARDLESLAHRLGRKLVNRGKHPIWESEVLKVPPVPIPHHGKPPEVSIAVRNGVLDILWQDVEAWDDYLGEESVDEEDE